MDPSQSTGSIMNLPNISISDYDRRDTAVHFTGVDRYYEAPQSRFSWDSSSYGDKNENDNTECQTDDPTSHLLASTTKSTMDSPSTTSSYTDVAARALESQMPLNGIGAWDCCMCKNTHGIHATNNEQHPTTLLECECGHCSCVNCAVEGQIKKFIPMNEPEVVQLSEDAQKEIRFGVYCGGCGTPWRAVEIKTVTTKKSVLQRISALPKRILKHGMHPLEKLRRSRSLNNISNSLDAPAAKPPVSHSTFNLRALSNEMEKGHGKQADFATVQFTGLLCSCGTVTDGSSLCFQIVDPPKDFYEVEFKKMMEDHRFAGFGSTPEDRAKGHGTPTITLKGHSHPNPLRSAPVSDEDWMM